MEINAAHDVETVVKRALFRLTGSVLELDLR